MNNVEEPQPAPRSAAACRRPPARRWCAARRATPSTRRSRACCTSSCCARRMRMRGSSRSTRRAALAVPGVHAVLTHEDAPERLFSTARHETGLDGPGRHPRARRRRALHRPEGRRRRRRQRGRRRGGLPRGSRSTTRSCRRCSIPSRRSRPARPCCIPTRRRRTASPMRSATSSPRSTANSATSPRRSPRPPSPRGHLHDPARPACRAGDPRRARLARRGRRAQRPLQHAGAVPDPAGAGATSSICTGQGPGVLRTGRRRLRRQAGDVRRGHSRAGRAQDRAAGQAGADARGAVHRDLDAASDAGPHQGRRRRATARSPRCRCAWSPTPAPTAITPARCCFTPAASRIGVYHCPNKRVDGYRRLHQHRAGRRVSRLRPAANADSRSSRRSTNWRGSSASDPFEMRRRNVVRPGDPMLSPPASADHDVLYGSYGLDQCLDLVERAMRADAPAAATSPPDWLVGEGVALTMIDTVPPGGHLADCIDRAARRRRLRPDRRHRRVRQRHHHRAPPDRGDRARRPRSTGSALRQSDTAHGGHDTGAYGSAGTFVAGQRDRTAAAQLAREA